MCGLEYAQLRHQVQCAHACHRGATGFITTLPGTTGSIVVYLPKLERRWRRTCIGSSAGSRTTTASILTCARAASLRSGSAAARPTCVQLTMLCDAAATCMVTTYTTAAEGRNQSQVFLLSRSSFNCLDRWVDAGKGNNACFLWWASGELCRSKALIFELAAVR